MNKIITFFKLENANKIIIIKAFLLLWIIRIMLWILPFSFIQKVLKKFTPVDENKNSKVSIKKTDLDS
jgi:hypothetical protein